MFDRYLFWVYIYVKYQLYSYFQFIKQISGNTISEWNNHKAMIRAKNV